MARAWHVVWPWEIEQNVFIKGADVHLYTHWAGSSLAKVVRRALARQQRWDDESYLARIIFCEMVKKDIKGETGFGISHQVGDGDDRIITLDSSTGQISNNTGGKAMTFTEFIALTDMAASKWFGGES